MPSQFELRDHDPHRGRGSLSIRPTKTINPIIIMSELFLPNPDSGVFGVVAHWLSMGFIFSFILGLPFVAVWSLLLFFPAIFLMMIFD
jgi:hypothetical protein